MNFQLLQELAKAKSMAGRFPLVVFLVDLGRHGVNVTPQNGGMFEQFGSMILDVLFWGVVNIEVGFLEVSTLVGFY